MNNEMKRAVSHIEMPEDMRRRILSNAKNGKNFQKLNFREVAALAASFLIFLASGLFYLTDRFIKPVDKSATYPQMNLMPLPEQLPDYVYTSVKNTDVADTVWGVDEDIRKCIREGTYLEWNGLLVSPELLEVLTNSTAEYVAMIQQSISDPIKEFEIGPFVMYGQTVPQCSSPSVVFTHIWNFCYFAGRDYRLDEEYFKDTVFVLAPISMK